MQKTLHFAKRHFIFFLSLFLYGAFFSFNLTALELKDVNSKLSDIFNFNHDSNEGTTVFRSLNIPSGGRAESLGTALTGLSDDINFLDYNPAGSAVLKILKLLFFTMHGLQILPWKLLQELSGTTIWGWGFN